MKLPPLHRSCLLAQEWISTKDHWITKKEFIKMKRWKHSLQYCKCCRYPIFFSFFSEEMEKNVWMLNALQSRSGIIIIYKEFTLKDLIKSRFSLNVRWIQFSIIQLFIIVYASRNFLDSMFEFLFSSIQKCLSMILNKSVTATKPIIRWTQVVIHKCPYEIFNMNYNDVIFHADNT